MYTGKENINGKKKHLRISVIFYFVALLVLPITLVSCLSTFSLANLFDSDYSVSKEGLEFEKLILNERSVCVSVDKIYHHNDSELIVEPRKLDSLFLLSIHAFQPIEIVNNSSYNYEFGETCERINFPNSTDRNDLEPGGNQSGFSRLQARLRINKHSKRLIYHAGGMEISEVTDRVAHWYELSIECSIFESESIVYSGSSSYVDSNSVKLGEDYILNIERSVIDSLLSLSLKGAIKS
jgi:hypothetical protein